MLGKKIKDYKDLIRLNNKINDLVFDEIKNKYYPNLDYSEIEHINILGYLIDEFNAQSLIKEINVYVDEEEVSENLKDILRICSNHYFTDEADAMVEELLEQIYLELE